MAEETKVRMHSVVIDYHHPGSNKTCWFRCLNISVDIVQEIARLMDLIRYISSVKSDVYVIPEWSNQVQRADCSIPGELLIGEAIVSTSK